MDHPWRVLVVFLRSSGLYFWVPVFTFGLRVAPLRMAKRVLFGGDWLPFDLPKNAGAFKSFQVLKNMLLFFRCWF